MTKDKAYEVLKINSNASTEEIKTAYAELSKKYHPEENPEEFQQIHEAYTTLKRGTKRGNRVTRTMVIERSGEIEDDISVGKSEADELIRFDFETAENQGQKEIQEKFLSELQQAVDKLDNFFSSCNTYLNPYALQRRMEELQFDILHNPTYVNKLYTLLQNRDCNDEIYKVIVNTMHLWDQELLQERKDLAKFKLFLDEKKAAYKNASELETMRIIFGIITALVVLVIVMT